MTRTAHIAVGKMALEHTSLKTDLEVYRRIYLFGCIAPDINFIYPLHNIQCTPKRFMKRIERMKKIKSKVIRSFTLGVIMHYICDYFTLAHNNSSYGPKHTIYERLMSHKVKTEEITFDSDMKTIEDFWNQAVSQYESGESCEFDKLVETQSLQSSDIFELVKNMNRQYLKYVRDKANENWCTDKTQMRTDLDWSLFMCERVGELVVA